MESIYDKLVAWADSNGYWAQYLLNLCFNNEEISQEELDMTNRSLLFFKPSHRHSFVVSYNFSKQKTHICLFFHLGFDVGITLSFP